MTCDKCGYALQIGDFPFCPHGSGFARVNGDECDYIDHNLGRTPVRIRSWSERRRLMDERGLQDFQYDVPVPDDMAPNSQRPSRWGAYRQMDPEHLAWLAERLSTGHAQKEPEEPLRMATYCRELNIGDKLRRTEDWR